MSEPTAFGGLLVFGSETFGGPGPEQLSVPSAPDSPLGGFVVFGRQTFGSPLLAAIEGGPTAATGVLQMYTWPLGPVDVGDTVTVAVQVLTSTGAPATPDQVGAVVCSVTVAGVATALDVSAMGQGVFQASWTAERAGTHTVAWLGAGGVLGAGQVWADAVPVVAVEGSFISVGQALAHLRAAGIIQTHEDREQLRWLCRVACEGLERDIGRIIARRVVREDVEPGGSTAVLLTQTPVLELVSVGGTAVVADSHRVDRYGILRSRAGWPASVWGSFAVEYLAGMDPVPAVLQKVALNAVQRMWQTSQNSPHPAFDGGGGGGGGDFAATAMMSALGQLTPVEWNAYQSYKAPGVA